jgi:hypothetical protein
MKKVIIGVALAVGVALVVKRLAPGCGKIDWQKRLAAMPDDAPPKWMFRNIAAIRENTDRVVELLEGRAVDGPEPRADVSVDV